MTSQKVKTKFSVGSVNVSMIPVIVHALHNPRDAIQVLGNSNRSTNRVFRSCFWLRQASRWVEVGFSNLESHRLWTVATLCRGRHFWFWCGLHFKTLLASRAVLQQPRLQLAIEKGGDRIAETEATSVDPITIILYIYMILPPHMFPWFSRGAFPICAIQNTLVDGIIGGSTYRFTGD